MVRSLVDEKKGAGSRGVTWDARDDQGEGVPSGLYFYKLSGSGFSEARKLVVVR